MFKSLHPALEAALIFLIIALLMAAMDCYAQEVSHCKNYETGEIIVIEAGFPCPFPTVQI